jgi:hypothetical protein
MGLMIWLSDQMFWALEGVVMSFDYLDCGKPPRPKSNAGSLAYTETSPCKIEYEKAVWIIII